MTDNTNKEHTDNPVNQQPELPPGEIPATGSAGIRNQNQESATMEVHHHSHGAHGKKNWKSYFWEFLMLFLAVFCGFLAEYQLEHKIEHERGKQYIRSLYEDMVADSARFSSLLINFTNKVSVLEDMSPCYDSLLSDHLSKNCLAGIMQQSAGFPDLTYTDRTLMQLKNAGGLRLLEKSDADSILLYDYFLRNYKTAETTGLQELQYELRETSAMLRDYEKWKDTANTPRVVALYGNNKDLLNKYFNQLSIYKNYCRARIIELELLKNSNTVLITYFKAKYHYE